MHNIHSGLSVSMACDVAINNISHFGSIILCYQMFILSFYHTEQYTQYTYALHRLTSIIHKQPHFCNSMALSKCQNYNKKNPIVTLIALSLQLITITINTIHWENEWIELNWTVLSQQQPQKKKTITSTKYP